MQMKHKQNLQEIEKLEAELAEAEAQLADAKRGREEDPEGGRAAKLAKLAEMEKEIAALDKEYQDLQQYDPKVLADLEKELELVTEAAHRWTDNIFNCKTYLVKKRGMDKKQAVRRLDLTLKLYSICM